MRIRPITTERTTEGGQETDKIIRLKNHRITLNKSNTMVFFYYVMKVASD